MTLTRVCLAKYVGLALAQSRSDVCVKLVEVARDTAVAHEAGHGSSRIVVVRVSLDVLLDRRVLGCDELCGAADAPVVARLGGGSAENLTQLGERDADVGRTSTSPSERTRRSGADDDDGEDMRLKDCLLERAMYKGEGLRR